MVTMKEALANVDVNELQKLAQEGNDFGLNFYNEKHDKDWEVSPKQMTGIINKIPKILVPFLVISIFLTIPFMSFIIFSFY